MIEYIAENKDWLFSGIGIVVATYIFKKRKKRNSNTCYENKNQTIMNKEIAEKNGVDRSEQQGISKRLKMYLELINDQNNFKISIGELAQKLNLSKISELEMYFKGDAEPTFKFMKGFCEFFGVNENWLIKSSGSPFSNRNDVELNPINCLPKIVALKPKEIWFIREKSEIARAFIILKIHDLKFHIMNRTWNISDHVGTVGESQLYGFYQLIIELRDKQFGIPCRGIHLNEFEFDELFLGKIFPGNRLFGNNPWWDDFTDIFNTYAISKNYKYWYGESFIKAQNIISDLLKKKVDG